ncbi:MAG: MBL fold metallo-hydrolase [Oscillospiraceae bacterium]|jgi:metal-dependent hydrolases of the beta-lactamase superfamily I|nr:MBL fold metallo-hydrolase [Oscillospiraceae bacterium]MBS6590169.1 MBL fold metallo-hydrolase [Ruminococcus sp.]
MPRIYPLFSSSKGNCTYIGTPESGVLIDCGASCRKICNALELNGLSTSAVKAIFITHEHSDHISGLKNFTKKTGIPVYAQSMTMDTLFDGGYINSHSYDMSGEVCIGNMAVSCFETSHDTPQSCGYRVDFSDGKSCCVCTDLGFVSDTVRNAVTGSSAVLLEANYDVNMLRNGPYPVYLKERIRSDHGHLSNDDSGNFGAELIKSGTTRLILGHLSQENNTPATAEYTVESIIAQNGLQRNSDYILSCAPVETGGGFISF